MWLVIGAGPSGLAVGAELYRRSIPFVIHEGRDRLGGVWADCAAGSPMYRGASLITSRRMTEYQGFPWSASVGVDYPNQEQVLQYLQSFASHFGLTPFIRCGSRVVSVTPTADHGWITTFDTGDSERFSGIIVCCGAQWYPRSQGLSILRHDSVRSANLVVDPLAEFADHSIAIVGGGNTAADLALLASRVTDRVTLILGRPRWLLPKYEGDLPSDYPRSVDRDPPGLRGHKFQTELRASLLSVHPNLTRRGWPQPHDVPLSHTVIIGDEILGPVSEGRVTVLAEHLDRIPDTVEQVVDARGYSEQIPVTLRTSCENASSLNWNDFSLNIFHRRFDNLFAVRQPRSDIGGFWPGQLAARLIAEAIELSSHECRGWNRLHGQITGADYQMAEGGNFSSPSDSSPFLFGAAYVDALGDISDLLGMDRTAFEIPSPGDR